MNLYEVKKDAVCILKSIEIENFEIKIRLMELGLVPGVRVKVVNKSLLKHTLLVVFCNSCFTLKDNLAKQIQVEYA